MAANESDGLEVNQEINQHLQLVAMRRVNLFLYLTIKKLTNESLQLIAMAANESISLFNDHEVYH